jgi:hypothetical protein
VEIPDNDLVQISAWCAQQWPPSLWDQVRVDFMVIDNTVIIMERRGPFTTEGSDLVEFIAKLEFLLATQMWRIWWVDSDSDFHLYQSFTPTTSIEQVLRFLDSQHDPIFWG